MFSIKLFEAIFIIINYAPNVLLWYVPSGIILDHFAFGLFGMAVFNV